MRRVWAVAALTMALVTAGTSGALAEPGPEGTNQAYGTVADGPLPTPDAPWPATGELSVFLCLKDTPMVACRGRVVTAEQRRNIKRAIKRLPGVSEVRFVTKREAYREFREAFAHNDTLLKDVRQSDMPEEFRARLQVRNDKLDAKLEKLPGVSMVIVSGTDFWDGKADAKVVLCSPKTAMEPCGVGDPITDQERDAVFETLRTVEGVQKIYLESHRHAAENLRRLVGGWNRAKPTLRDALEASGETFHLVLSSPADFSRIRPALKGLPGVAEIGRHG
ncbi:permease-like cell division protein FtsX [Nonomuraea typhae]|uniref:permease-like cell division protein FtsX n=1 Tax=Nonomuraea typhae TaxID=2603600 RepID=UPI0012FB4F45|nr:permease-like cell division protein FtsX [Nonomuraea typhae]